MQIYKIERNEKIFLEYITLSDQKKGLVKDIAKRENLSPWRVYKIIHDHAAKLLPKPEIKYCAVKAFSHELKQELLQALHN